MASEHHHHRELYNKVQQSELLIFLFKIHVFKHKVLEYIQSEVTGF